MDLNNIEYAVLKYEMIDGTAESEEVATYQTYEECEKYISELPEEEQDNYRIQNISYKYSAGDE